MTYRVISIIAKVNRLQLLLVFGVALKVPGRILQSVGARTYYRFLKSEIIYVRGTLYPVKDFLHSVYKKSSKLESNSHPYTLLLISKVPYISILLPC